MTTPLIKPTTIVEPFANSGSKNTIPVTASATPGRASLDTGFPPLTMTPVAQGGVPPSGQDFNGILNWITQHTTWLNAGGQYTFDAPLAAFIGGYPVGMVLQSNDGTSSYVNVQAGNSTDFNTTPSAIGVSWLPYGGAAVSPQGTAVIDVTAGDVTLTNPQAARQVVIVTGTPGAARNVIFPTFTKEWTVINGTASTVTCKTSAAVGIPIAPYQTDAICYNTTSIVYAQSQAVTQAPGDNSTFIATTAFVTAAIAAALVNTPLTGTPTAPTAAVGSNNTQVANTNYVDRAVGILGAGSVPQYRNANFTAGQYGDYWIDTSAGAFTMTLPDPPIAQNCLRVRDTSGTWGTNFLTINPGTKTILGASGSLVCDIAGEVIELWYNGSDWRIA